MMETKKLTDTFIVSYLSLLGFQVKPIKNGNIIAFEVSGDSITEAIESFYENPKIKIMDFCKAYRTIRSALFNLK